MKIGILTLPLDENYGGILQAYALQNVLNAYGYEAIIIGKAPAAPPNWFEKINGVFKRIAYVLVKQKNTEIRWWKAQERTNSLRSNTDKFISKHLTCKYYNHLSDIKDSDYEAIVVGSDQVWRKVYFAPNWDTTIEDAFLRFAEKWNIRRVSYAASFGLDHIEEYSNVEKKTVVHLLKLFNNVSVREESGISICNNFGVASICVADPTMLLNKDQYLSLIENYAFDEKGELFNYILDLNEYKSNIIQSICVSRKWSSFRVNASFDGCINIQRPVEDWLSGFKVSKAVVTDSFHACVFSLIFNKPFLVIPNPERGITRIESLLRKFGQTDRIVWKESELKDKISLLDVNPNVQNVLDKYKKESLDYIQISLS